MTGQDLDPDDFGGGPPAPPPAPSEVEAAPAAVGSEPPREMVDLGAPPTDHLALQAYMHRALAVAIRDAMLDPGLSPTERRREVRQLALASRALVPEVEIHEAVKLIKGDQAQLAESRQRPKLQPVPPKASRGSAG